MLAVSVEGRFSPEAAEGIKAKEPTQGVQAQRPDFAVLAASGGAVTAPIGEVVIGHILIGTLRGHEFGEQGTVGEGCLAFLAALQSSSGAAAEFLTLLQWPECKERGSLTDCRNPSAVLLGRIRDAKQVISSQQQRGAVSMPAPPPMGAGMPMYGMYPTMGFPAYGYAAFPGYGAPAAYGGCAGCGGCGGFGCGGCCGGCGCGGCGGGFMMGSGRHVSPGWG
ncbi:unnamed protein product [Prorocentrum cordatum]|uniref:Subtilisin n=1 Tax=Prorocentrum cordatum TaxID=2364126 RepID=A0ABN9U8M2_9DINO|nr:unnamed protein product [Polarella glacialis]